MCTSRCPCSIADLTGNTFTNATQINKVDKSTLDSSKDKWGLVWSNDALESRFLSLKRTNSLFTVDNTYTPLIVSNSEKTYHSFKECYDSELKADDTYNLESFAITIIEAIE
jgi:hypothetical protein